VVLIVRTFPFPAKSLPSVSELTLKSTFVYVLAAMKTKLSRRT
jgi:hypothetical protein